MLICSKSREITAEYKQAIRFSNTSVKAQQILVTNARNGKFASRHVKQKQAEKATPCGSRLKVFSKGTAYESRIPVSNLKTLTR